MMKQTLIFLLLFASLVSPASCIGNATDVILTGQGGIVAIVIMLTAIGIAIAYMIGNFSGNPRFTILAKDELYHLAVSIGLLISFSGIVLFSCTLMSYFFTSTFEKMMVSDSSGTPTTLACYAEGAELSSVSTCYIKLAKSDAEQIAQQYLKEYINNQMYATFSVTIQIPVFNAQTVSADAYKKVYSQQYDMVLNSFIIPALLSLTMQKIILEFISQNVIAWVLPAAFLLRIFPPTRQMGNFLIALSVGLYIIIPFMYTFNLAMYDISAQDCSTFSSATNDIVFGDGCSTYGFWNVGRLLPQAFFLPNLTLALFVTFLSAVNKALKVIG